MSLFPLLLLKSSTSNGTKLSSSPLFSPRSSSSHCLPWTSPSVSSLRSTSLDNSHQRPHADNHTQARACAPSSFYSCAEIFLLFLSQSLSQNPKSAQFCLSLSMLWNASSRLGRPKVINHPRDRRGCIKSPSAQKCVAFVYFRNMKLHKFFGVWKLYRAHSQSWLSAPYFFCY